MANLQTLSAVCSMVFGLFSLPGGIYASIQLYQQWKSNDPERKMLRILKVICVAAFLVIGVASLVTGSALLFRRTPPATVAVTPSPSRQPEPPKLQTMQPEHNEGPTTNGSRKPSHHPKEKEAAGPTHSSDDAPTSSTPVTVNADNNQGNVAGINYGTQNTFNTGKPLPHIVNFATEILPAQSGPTSESQGQLNPGLQLHFRVDSAFAAPFFLVHCDKPCRATNIVFGHGSYASGGWLGKAPFFRTNDPKTVGVGGGLKAVLYPAEDIMITVRAMDSAGLASATVEASEQ